MSLLAKAHAEQILRIDRAFVEAQCVPQRGNSRADVASAKAGQREFVRDPGRPVVEPSAPFVSGDRAVVLLSLEKHIAERFERSRRRRIEVGCRAKVARGGFEIAVFATTLVGL